MAPVVVAVAVDRRDPVSSSSSSSSSNAYLFIHSFVYLFIYLFICLFVYNLSPRDFERIPGPPRHAWYGVP